MIYVKDTFNFLTCRHYAIASRHTRTHFINRVRCVCLITWAGKAGEAVNSLPIDNESNAVQHAL